VSTLCSPRLGIRVFYAPGDEVLATTIFFGIPDDTTPPPIQSSTTQALVTIAENLTDAFAQIFNNSTLIIGCHFFCPDDETVQTYQCLTRKPGLRVGSPLPNTAILNLRFTSVRVPPPAPPKRLTYSGGLRLSGFLKDDQDEGTWSNDFRIIVKNNLTDFLTAGFEFNVKDYVLAAGGEGNQFTINNVLAMPVVARSIDRVGNRSQGHSNVTPV